MKCRKKPKPEPGVEIRPLRDQAGVYYVFRVRWKDKATGRRLVETFDSMDDALDFRAQLRLSRRRGTLDELERGRVTLNEFIAFQWWPNAAIPTLEDGTLKIYRTMIRAHLAPRIGDMQLRHITAAKVAKLRADLERDGIGPTSTRKALTVLQSIMRSAAEWGEVPANPVASVRKPKQHKKPVHPPAPEQVERIRRLMSPQDAALLAALAYSGLRPQEATALRWSAVGRSTILVEAKNVSGQIYQWQKNHSGYRTVRLLDPLRAILEEYKPDGAGPRDLVFPRPDGTPWNMDHDWPNWRNRNYAPARVLVPGVGPRPYDLRHAFASLLLHQGVQPVAVAEELGHSLQTLMDRYAHIINDLRGQPAEDAAATIASAQQRVASEPAPTVGPRPKAAGKNSRGPWTWWDLRTTANGSKAAPRPQNAPTRKDEND